MNDTQFSLQNSRLTLQATSKVGTADLKGSLAEATAGLIHTFFRDPKIGGVQFIGQYLYVRRTPFSVPAGTPADASVNMIYLNVRYFLP